ncbi:MAG: HlyD family efflux transporter periplasmic adaptor subunit [Flavobacteriaceae bacterium]
MLEKSQNIELRSEQVQEILTAVPNWMIRWGNTLLLFLLLMLLFISWFVKYPDIIATEAVVTTEIPPEKIYARTTGKITRFLVNDSHEISKNTAIAIIENTANYKDVFLLKTILDTIKLNRESFKFPIDDIPLLFLGEIDNEFAMFENSYLQYTLNKELNPFSYENAANKTAINEMKRRLQNMQSQKKLNESELNFKKKGLKRQEELFNKGIISEQTFEDKQQEVLRAERAYQNLSLSISQLIEAISNGYKSEKGTQINKTREEKQLLKTVIQSFNQLKRAVKDWEYNYVLKSSINGNVSYLSFWNESQTVQTGDLVFTILPFETKNYIAKLKAPVRNSGKIKKGQSVQIKLENYPSDEFGVLNGTISSISSIPDNEGMYLIDVNLSNKMITSYNRPIIFKQEMIGSADIITEDLRLIDRFFSQLKSAIDH